LAVLLVCLAAAQAFVVPAPYLVRAPQHDSALIKSDRLGGNFAYSVTEVLRFLKKKKWLIMTMLLMY
jgi:hypothetical protein